MAKGAQVQEQAKTPIQKARDTGNAVVEAVKGEGQGFGQIIHEPRSIKNLGHVLNPDNAQDALSNAQKLIPTSPLMESTQAFGQSIKTANQSPAAGFLQYKQGTISKAEFDKRQQQYGSAILPSQATDPSTAKDWEQVAMARDPDIQGLLRTQFQKQHGVDWQPPTDPQKTAHQQAAQREVASGAGRGQSNFWNNVWWASQLPQRTAGQYPVHW
jgi:hypothetical protein